MAAERVIERSKEREIEEREIEEREEDIRERGRQR